MNLVSVQSLPLLGVGDGMGGLSDEFPSTPKVSNVQSEEYWKRKNQLSVRQHNNLIEEYHKKLPYSRVSSIDSKGGTTLYSKTSYHTKLLLSFEWSHFRDSFTDSKVRTTLYTIVKQSVLQESTA